jgi:hypothetical protein
MFQINSYLQYKNTPDGKPRVLKLPSQYEVFNKDLEIPRIKKQQHITYYDSGEGIVEVSVGDCRPLLSGEIDGQWWTEGDIIEQPPLGYPNSFHQDYVTAGGMLAFTRGSFSFRGFNKEDKITPIHYGGGSSTSPFMVQISKQSRRYPIKKLGSFFDDPAKYSKLLWNCSEEEGWKKVFKLLLSR